MSAGGGNPGVSITGSGDNALVRVEGCRALFRAWVDPAGQTYNGWGLPRFTRAEAEAVVRWLDGQYEADPVTSDRAEWDGDVIVHHVRELEGDPGYLPERVGPDESGRYALGAGLWTWQQLMPEWVTPQEADVQGAPETRHVRNLYAWVSAAQRFGIGPDDTAHDYFEQATGVGLVRDDVAGAVCYGRFWYLIVAEEGQLRPVFIGEEP